MNTQPELILDARCQVGESLIWHAKQQAIYWVDITAKTLHRYNLSSAQHFFWDTPEMLGCIALRINGGLIAGAETGLLHINFSNDNQLINTTNKLNTVNTTDKIDTINIKTNFVAAATHTAQSMRFNDGRCDRQGRFLASTMVSNQTVGLGNPSIYQYNPTPFMFKTLLNSVDLPQPFTTPNGMAFSPDGRLFYLSDSHSTQQRVWQFDYDIDTGTPYNRREWLNFEYYAGRPDGATIDIDGCYWVCATDAGMIHRFTPQGKLDYSLRVPVKKPTICTWGGSNLSTLYVASIRPVGDISDQALAGAIFAFHGLGTQGIAETLCQ
jgi:sugar lactone lactonase YvrE